MKFIALAGSFEGKEGKAHQDVSHWHGDTSLIPHLRCDCRHYCRPCPASEAGEGLSKWRVFHIQRSVQVSLQAQRDLLPGLLVLFRFKLSQLDPLQTCAVNSEGSARSRGETMNLGGVIRWRMLSEAFLTARPTTAATQYHANCVIHPAATEKHKAKYRNSNLKVNMLSETPKVSPAHSQRNLPLYAICSTEVARGRRHTRRSWQLPTWSVRCPASLSRVDALTEQNDIGRGSHGCTPSSMVCSCQPAAGRRVSLSQKPDSTASEAGLGKKRSDVLSPGRESLWERAVGEREH
eukprot:28884-Rhodomonas_salina.1